MAAEALAPSPGRRSTARPGRAGYAILLNSMFDLPSLEGVKEVVISQPSDHAGGQVLLDAVR